MDEKRNSRIARHGPTLAWILGAASFFLRAGTVQWDPLWTDEAITVDFAKATWDGLILRLLYDASPPGSYLLFGLWDSLTAAPFEIRYLSALAGALTVPALFFLGRRLYGPFPGLLAAFLLALNPYHFFYSQEIRYPALLTLFLTLQMWAFVRFWDRKDWPGTVLWSLFSVLAAWIQYFAFLVLAAQFAWLAMKRNEWKGVLIKPVAGVSAMTLLILPLVPLLLVQLGSDRAGRPFLSLFSSLLHSSFFPVLGGSEFNLPGLHFGRTVTAADGLLYVAVAGVFVLPFLYFMIRGLVYDLRESGRGGLGAVSAVAPWLLFLAASRFVPLFRPKYILPLIPIGLCIVAVGVFARKETRTPVRLAAAFLLPLILAFGLYNQHVDPLCRREGWDRVVSMIDAYAKPGDVILIPNRYHSLGFDYSYQGNLPVLSSISDTPHAAPVAKAILERRMKNLEQRYLRFWIVNHKTAIFDPDGFVSRYADDHWRQVTQAVLNHPFHDVPVSLYARDEREQKKSMLPGLDFPRGLGFSFQLGPGFLERTANGHLWMGKRAEVEVAPDAGDNLAYGCFFVHRPFFESVSPTAALTVDGVSVSTRSIEATGRYCLEGRAPALVPGKETLKVGIEFDRTFVPDRLLHDGDMRPKTALVERIGVTSAARRMEAPCESP